MPRQVDLIGAYSNHRNRADLLKRARRWVSEDHLCKIQDPQKCVRAKPTSNVPRWVVDRLGPGAVQEIVEACRVGAKLRDVAERWGISESSVKRITRTQSY